MERTRWVVRERRMQGPQGCSQARERRWFSQESCGHASCACARTFSFFVVLVPDDSRGGDGARWTGPHRGLPAVASCTGAGAARAWGKARPGLHGTAAGKLGSPARGKCRRARGGSTTSLPAMAAAARCMALVARGYRADTAWERRTAATQRDWLQGGAQSAARSEAARRRSGHSVATRMPRCRGWREGAGRDCRRETRPRRVNGK
jgi:hypothetical protein